MTTPNLFALQLTPAAVGAIAVVLVGDDGSGIAEKALAEMSRTPLNALRPPDRTGSAGGLKKVTFVSKDGTPIDEALIIRTAPARWELHLHGGIAVVDAVLDELRALGAKILNPPDPQADKLLGSPADAELLRALSRANTSTALATVLAQPHALGNWAGFWRNWLNTAATSDLWQLQSAAQWLLLRSKTLMQLFHPPRIAIVGPPNAGKSTLANALLGRPMSITSDIAGTTRDWVDAQAIFVGSGEDPVHIAVTLVDTAGVRDAADALEQLSIDRTHAQAKQADAIIALFDASRNPSPAELSLLETLAPATTIIAGNKMDQTTTMPATLAALSAIPISARTAAGLGELMTRTLARLDLSRLARNEPCAFSARQQDVLQSLALADDAAACRNLLDALAVPPA